MSMDHLGYAKDAAEYNSLEAQTHALISIAESLQVIAKRLGPVVVNHTPVITLPDQHGAEARRQAAQA